MGRWQQRCNDGEDDDELTTKQQEAHVTHADIGEAYEVTRVSLQGCTPSQIKLEIAMKSIDLALARQFAEGKAKAAVKAKKAKKVAGSRLRNRTRDAYGQFI